MGRTKGQVRLRRTKPPCLLKRADQFALHTKEAGPIFFHYSAIARQYVRNVVGSASFTGLCIWNVFFSGYCLGHIPKQSGPIVKAEQSALFTKKGGPPVLSFLCYHLNIMHTCICMLFYGPPQSALAYPGPPRPARPILPRPALIRSGPSRYAPFRRAL